MGVEEGDLLAHEARVELLSEAGHDALARHREEVLPEAGHHRPQREEADEPDGVAVHGGDPAALLDAVDDQPDDLGVSQRQPGGAQEREGGEHEASRLRARQHQDVGQDRPIGAALHGHLTRARCGSW